MPKMQRRTGSHDGRGERRVSAWVTSAVEMGSPRRARQAVESMACMGSHRLASSGAGAGTDVTLVDPGDNASPSTTRRGRG
jgi:hypothetical protein